MPSRSFVARSPRDRALAAFLLGALALGGCVATVPRPRPPGPTARAIEGVPPLRFGVENCGAGSLAGVFAALGEEVPLAELDAALPKAVNGGVLTLDLVLEARARGFSARLLEGSPAVVHEAIERGLPTILALRVVNAPGTRGDLFHYVVADGFDPGRGLVRLQYGDGVFRWVGFGQIDGSWRAAGRALIVIEPRPPGAPLSGTEVRYAVALEEGGRLDEAAALYRHLLGRDPSSALLWTNLGNVESARGARAEAEAAYRRALALEPAFRDALNNLAWLLLEQGERLDEAADLASRAVAADGPDPHLVLDTLAHALRARGDCRGALAAAERAVALALPDSPVLPDLEEHLAATRSACLSAGHGC